MHLATTQAELTAGLSGLASIPPDTGMLFVLPYKQAVTVTTQGLYFPIDIVFITGNFKVKSVAQNVCPGFLVTEQGLVRYFLEVNAGEAAGIGYDDPVNIIVTEWNNGQMLLAETNDWISPIVSVAGLVMVGGLMARMGKTMAGVMSAKPKEKPLIFGPRGEIMSPQTRLPTFKGYTVDYRLREFRKARYGKELEFIPFDSPKGRKLLSEMKRSPDSPTEHSKDSDCILGKDNICMECGVYHGDACPACGQRGYHIPGCAETRQIEGDIEAFEDMLSKLSKRHNVSTTRIAGILLDHDIRSICDLPGQEKLDAIIREGLKVNGGRKKDTFYWTAKNKKTGEVVMSASSRISPERALRAGRDYVKQNWKDPALVEVWDRPVALRPPSKDRPPQIKLPSGVKPVAAETVTVEEGLYYWTALEKDTGQIAEYDKAYTSPDRAFSAAKKWVFKHWPGSRVEIKVWDRPRVYSGVLPDKPFDIAPVKSGLVSGQEEKPAVIPKKPRLPRRDKEELEYLPDSPEFLAYTIEDIGYRDKIDSAFMNAISRSKGGSRK